MLPGVAILTRRADALAMSLASTELASVRADSTQRQLVLDVALDESFLVARLDDSQRVEAACVPLRGDGKSASASGSARSFRAVWSLQQYPLFFCRAQSMPIVAFRSPGEVCEEG